MQPYPALNLQTQNPANHYNRLFYNELRLGQEPSPPKNFFFNSYFFLMNVQQISFIKEENMTLLLGENMIFPPKKCFPV